MRIGVTKIAQRTEPITTPEAVKRCGMQRKNEGAHGAEHQGGCGDPHNTGQQMFRQRNRPKPGIRAPVGIGQGRIRDFSDRSTDRQRQSEVTHHQIRLDLIQQFKIRFDIPLQRCLVVKRATTGKRFKKLARRNTPQWPLREGVIREKFFVPRCAGEMDFMLCFIQAPRQHQGARYMRERDRLSHE